MDITTGKASSVTTPLVHTFSGITVASAFIPVHDLVMWVGLFFTVATFILNWYYKRKEFLLRVRDEKGA